MLRKRFLCLLGLMIILGASVVAQTKRGKVGDGHSRVERSASRPDLATKLDEVAELKIASRKSVFHLGEMMTLDIALLNTSSYPLFFRKLSEVRVNAITPSAQDNMVQEYGVADRAIVPTAFVRLAPGEIIVRSFQILAGCDKRAFAQISSSEDNDRTVFNRGLFLNWGDACLPNTQPETYTVSVEMANDFVLLPSRVIKSKTAVGTIKSNSLQLTIRW